MCVCVCVCVCVKIAYFLRKLSVKMSRLLMSAHTSSDLLVCAEMSAHSKFISCGVCVCRSGWGRALSGCD